MCLGNTVQARVWSWQTLNQTCEKGPAAACLTSAGRLLRQFNVSNLRGPPLIHSVSLRIMRLPALPLRSLLAQLPLFLLALAGLLASTAAHAQVAFTGAL